MKILCDSGVVTGHSEGKWIHYSLSKAGLEHAVSLLAPFQKAVGL